MDNKIIFAIGDVDVEEFIKNNLENYSVIDAVNNREAVMASLSAKLATSTQCVLVIREALPGRMPIVELCEVIRVEFPNIRIVFMGGEHMPGDPLLVSLINMGIYDVYSSTPDRKSNVHDVIELIKNPKTYGDIAYLKGIGAKKVVREDREDVSMVVLEEVEEKKGLFGGFRKKKTPVINDTPVTPPVTPPAQNATVPPMVTPSPYAPPVQQQAAYQPPVAPSVQPEQARTVPEVNENEIKQEQIVRKNKRTAIINDAEDTVAQEPAMSEPQKQMETVNQEVNVPTQPPVEPVKETVAPKEPPVQQEVVKQPVMQAVTEKLVPEQKPVTAAVPMPQQPVAPVSETNTNYMVPPVSEPSPSMPFANVQPVNVAPTNQANVPPANVPPATTQTGRANVFGAYSENRNHPKALPLAFNTKILNFLGSGSRVGNRECAFNIAVSLSNKNKRVLYVDVSDGFSELLGKLDFEIQHDVCDFLKLQNVGNLNQYIVNLRSLSERAMDENDRGRFSMFNKGLDVMCKTANSSYESSYDVDALEEFLFRMKKECCYDYVILVSSAVADERYVEVSCKYADRTFITLTQFSADIRNTKELLDYVGGQNNKVSLVINKYEKMFPRDVEISNVMGVESVFTIFCDNKGFLEADARCLPYIMIARNHKILGQYANIVKSVS